jgi:putative colanic acid biosynthesis UDP-glucose lipid carrier transferase
MGLLARYQTTVRLFQRLLDPVAVAALLWALAAAFDHAFGPEWFTLAILAALTVAAVFEAARLYRPWRAEPVHRELVLVAWAWLVAAGVLFGLGAVTHALEAFPGPVLLTWVLATPLLLVALHGAVRLALRLARGRGRNLKTYVIVGGGTLARRLHQRLAANPWLGLQPLGYFDDRARVRDSEPLPVPRLGAIGDLAAYLRTASPHYVYLALPPRPRAVVRQVVDDLDDSTASVYLVPDVFASRSAPSAASPADDFAVIALRESPFAGMAGSLKRAEDLLLASLILVFISPVLVAIAAAVKLTSPGPVIFAQRRYGLDGRVFRVWKFRTMSVCEEGDQFVQASRGDVRVTPLGAFLRRTSLDELPQFFNVLQGHMSIVGPRPHPTALDERYRSLIKGYVLRHRVRPGITGLAQVNGFRGETDTLEKMAGRVRYDLEYIKGWSLLLDLRIILQTIWKGFRGENAY